ncbi:hypothetical protein DFP73DRAFT_636467 [Morchella snyderi]|nr:hypothetical protein DFP73DRAFT_636467 [Morchella snyderi]
MKFTLFATTLLTATLVSSASLDKRYVTAAPGPTQGAAIESCNRWDYIASGMTCYDILTKYTGLTLNQIVSYNPFLTADCTNMWANYWICSGVAANSTSLVTSATGCVASTATVTVTVTA